MNMEKELEYLWQLCHLSPMFTKNQPTPQQKGCEFVSYLLRPDLCGNVPEKQVKEFLHSALHWYRVETGDYK